MIYTLLAYIYVIFYMIDDFGTITYTETIVGAHMRFPLSIHSL